MHVVPLLFKGDNWHILLLYIGFNTGAEIYSPLWWYSRVSRVLSFKHGADQNNNKQTTPEFMLLLPGVISAFEKWCLFFKLNIELNKVHLFLRWCVSVTSLKPVLLQKWLNVYSSGLFQRRGGISYERADKNAFYVRALGEFSHSIIVCWLVWYNFDSIKQILFIVQLYKRDTFLLLLLRV